MIKREDGFNLIELLIAMTVFVLVIAAASGIFTGLLTQFKQQSKIAETNIEGIVGLEVLRRDLEHAGYGLPWNGLIAYNEADGDPFNLNDATTTTAPRAIVSANNANFSSPNDIFNGSDYLVIKAVNITIDDACERWTILRASAPHNPKVWTPANQNLAGTDWVIVVSEGTTATTERALITNGGAFSTTYASVTASPWQPADPAETHIIYGVGSDATLPNLRMPFNRADYFIRGFDSNGNNITPQRCATNTGVFEKVVINQSDGQRSNFLSLLDCVADMQVIYRRDTNDDGTIDNETDDISALTAQQIREQVKEVRVYVLAHEGQYDRDYTFNNFTCGANCITVGEFGLGRNFDLTAILNFQNYRWKLYTLVVKPNNLE